MRLKSWGLFAGIAILAFLTLFFYWRLLKTPYLTFSDAAKFADVAREVTRGNFFVTNFSFFPDDFSKLSGQEHFQIGLLPLYPFLLALSFIFLGISDGTVILASGALFILSVILVYFLAEKLFDGKTAILAGLAFIFSPPMLEYASLGASESLFILEILLVFYLLTFQSTKKFFLAGLVVSLMFLTRQQTLIYLLGFISAILILAKKELMVSFLAGVLILMVPLLIFSKVTGLLLFGQQPLSLLFESSSIASQNVTLRGGISEFGFQDILINLRPLAVKIFYNLYNFYKSLPGLFSSYLLALFILSLIKKEKDRLTSAFKLATLLIFLLSLLGAAITIPFARYVHPVVPLLIIFSVSFLVWLTEKLNRSFKLAVLVILFFVVGQTLGQIFLDSRFLGKMVNKDKPPVSFLLGEMVGEESNPKDLVVTNLDTWGSWYGERKTVWLPFKPDQLVPSSGKSNIDVIFLSSYLANDLAQALGKEWSQILDNPESPGNEFIKENFYLAKRFKILPQENYSREQVYGVILKRKSL